MFPVAINGLLCICPLAYAAWSRVRTQFSNKKQRLKVEAIDHTPAVGNSAGIIPSCNVSQTHYDVKYFIIKYLIALQFSTVTKTHLHIYVTDIA